MNRRNLITRAITDIFDSLLGRRSVKGLVTIEPEMSSQVTTALAESKEAWLGGNFYKAWQVSRKAMNCAPEGTSSSDLAELIQICKRAKEEVEEYESALPAILQELADNPANGNVHLKLGTHLTALGQTDHALSYYFKALQYFDSTDKDFQRDCLNNIGWYHYVRGEYEEALDWFDKAISIGEGNAPYRLEDVATDTPAKTKQANEPFYLALENKLMCLTALGRAAQAEKTAQQYIFHHGRIPAAEAHALSTLGIDADQLFVDHERKTLKSADWMG